MVSEFLAATLFKDYTVLAITKPGVGGQLFPRQSLEDAYLWSGLKKITHRLWPVAGFLKKKARVYLITFTVIREMQIKSN